MWESRYSIFLLLLILPASFAISLPFLPSNHQTADANSLETVVEYVVNPVGPESKNYGDSQYHNMTGASIATIDVQGYWNKQSVTISAQFDNTKHTSEITQDLATSVGGPFRQNGSNFSGWQTIYDNVASGQDKAKLRLDLSLQNKTTIMPDVYIHFTNALGNNVGKARIAAITYLTIHESDHTILRSNITVYETDRLIDQGILLPIIIHELGHSLGIGHSTDKSSIMYPSLQMDAGKPIGKISGCEIAALNSLYAYRSGHTLGNLPCIS